MDTKKVVPIKSKVPAEMPSFVEPAFSRRGGQVITGFFIHNPFVRDDCIFLSEEDVKALAAWINSEL